MELTKLLPFPVLHNNSLFAFDHTTRKVSLKHHTIAINERKHFSDMETMMSVKTAIKKTGFTQLMV